MTAFVNTKFLTRLALNVTVIAAVCMVFAMKATEITNERIAEEAAQTPARIAAID